MEAFGQIARTELTSLVSVFQSTLTFTVTFQAVSSLVDQDESVVPLVFVATVALTFVLLALIEPAKSQLPDELNGLVSYLLGLAAKLSTQFVSNLVAVSLRTVFVEADTTWWIVAFSIFSISLLWVASQRLG